MSALLAAGRLVEQGQLLGRQARQVAFEAFDFLAEIGDVLELRYTDAKRT